MKFKLRPKAKLNEEERQLVLQFVASLYTDFEEVPRKPPSPERPKPALLQMRKAAS